MIFANFSKNHPMKHLKYLLLLLVVTSCNAPRASFDYDPQVSFSQFQTYKIYPDLVSKMSQLDEQRVLSILDSELNSKGFTTSENPDVYINFYSSEYQSDSRNTLGIGVGGGGGNMGVGVSGGIPIGGPQTNMRLTIDFIAVENDALIWQAVVDSQFNFNASPEVREAKLQKMIQEALNGYPPEKK